MITRQQLPSLVVLLSVWVAAISLSMPWLEGSIDPDEAGSRPSLSGQASGYWLATDGMGPVPLAVLVLVGTAGLLVLGNVAAATSISWTGITLAGLAVAMVLIAGLLIAEGPDGNTPVAGFHLWRGALIVAIIGGGWHSFVVDALLRTSEQTDEETD